MQPVLHVCRTATVGFIAEPGPLRRQRLALGYARRHDGARHPTAEVDGTLGPGVLGGIARVILANVPDVVRRRLPSTLLLDAVAVGPALGILVRRRGNQAVDGYPGLRTGLVPARGCLDVAVHQTALHDLLLGGALFTTLVLTDFVPGADRDLLATLTGSRLVLLATTGGVLVLAARRSRSWAWVGSSPSPVLAAGPSSPRGTAIITLDQAVPLVRPMAAADLPAAAALHERALPGSFFVRLGRPYLRAYLETFVAGPHAVALVAVVGDQIVGMLVGTTANRSHYAWVSRRRGGRLLLAGLAGLVLRPPAMVLFLRTRLGSYVRGLTRLRRDAPAQPRTAASALDVAVLTHVAVDQHARGLGLGAALVGAFAQTARRAGARRAELVTAADETGAGAFYEHLGWTFIEDRAARDGEPVRSYRYDLEAPA